jgi:hypothetical protein
MRSLLRKIADRVVQALVRRVRDDSPLDPRTSPATKLAIASFHADWRSRARRGERLAQGLGVGARIFSQFEEDGLLLYLDAVLELEHRSFVDIGAADGINSNCANLALNLGWHGLFIDGDPQAIARGRRFYEQHPDTQLWPPVFVEAFITRENINQLVLDAGFAGPVGIMSIDIDGNDYWVWEAVSAIDPALVVIETHIEFGMRDIVVPYDPQHVYPGRHPDYFSASPVAMVKLAGRKGYRLVGANRYGFNLIFVKRGLHEDRVPEVSLESVLTHPRYRARLDRFEVIKDWKYETPD